MTHVHKLKLLPCVAMNMSNMVGVGPFLTIPLVLAAVGGPQALLAWILAAVLALFDGIIWAELATALPCSGGSFEYLKVGYAGTALGRMFPFLFIWQFLLSGPLEIASGAIGFADYLGYLVYLGYWPKVGLAMGACVLVVFLLYRKIESVGRLMVALWAGVILTIAVVLVCGLLHFDAGKVMAFPPEAFHLSGKFFDGLGQGMSLSMYAYLGYYSVCFIGNEVKNPKRTMPWSILISVIVIALVYVGMNVAVLSVVPLEKAMESTSIGADFMERLYGPFSAQVVTVLICWTALASVFALMLAYSRIPYAAARDGYFFSVFGRLHPRGDFPHVSLLVLGGVSMAACAFPLEVVIASLMTTRILVQFLGQIGAATLLRRKRTSFSTFRLALYSLPGFVAFAGWTYIFATSGVLYITIGLDTLVIGFLVFLEWSDWSRTRAFPTELQKRQSPTEEV